MAPKTNDVKLQDLVRTLNDYYEHVWVCVRGATCVLCISGEHADACSVVVAEELRDGWWYWQQLSHVCGEPLAIELELCYMHTGRVQGVRLMAQTRVSQRSLDVLLPVFGEMVKAGLVCGVEFKSEVLAPSWVHDAMHLGAGWWSVVVPPKACKAGFRRLVHDCDLPRA